MEVNQNFMCACRNKISVDKQTSIFTVLNQFYIFTSAYTSGVYILQQARSNLKVPLNSSKLMHLKSEFQV